MEHGFLDKYSEIKSPVQAVEPRVKTFTFLLATAVAAFLNQQELNSLIAIFSLSLLLFFVSRLPPLLYFKRLAMVAPPIVMFSAVYSFADGAFVFDRFIFYALKAVTCFNFVFLLVATTRFDRLLNSLRFFKMPPLILSMLSFLYRYIFVIQDELERMLRARDARVPAADRKDRLKIMFNLVGMIFLRSYDRSERIYRSMVARGYSIENSHSSVHEKVKYYDLAFLAFIALVTIGAILSL